MTAERSQSTETTVLVDYGSEVFVEMLNANGVEYLFLNPGSDTFPIQEAMAKFIAKGKPVPKAILCLDEATAIAAAHGYFMVSGRPQVVLVHTDLGTLQLGGGVHNAQRGHAGIVLCAGRVPATFDGELTGGRTQDIHWIQEQPDQAGILRNYTKWDYELRRSENIQHVMQRAFQIASSQPYGPVYLMLPREVLMEGMTEFKVLPVERYGPVTTPQADPDALARAAEMLRKAQSPLIITGHSGRNHGTVAAMVELAELVGAPVVSDSTHLNFPTTHALYAGLNPQPYLKDADVVLIVDHDVPYIPAHGKPGPEARIIHIDIDPIKQTIPMWLFPTDLLLHADSAKAIPALVEAAKELMTEADHARILERSQLIKDRHQRQRQEAVQLALSHADRSPITPQWLSYCLNQVIDQDTIFLDESVTNSRVVVQYLERSRPGTLYKSGGSHLGWGLGAALGTKLAEPDRTVVAAVGDGAFVYGCPTSTLWTADAYGTPFLAVIYNNQLYNAPKRHLKEAYPESYSASTDNWIGMDITPSVDFAMLAQACRAYGELVQEPGDVKPALERALEQVRGGKAAVLDVRIERP